jgi:MFS family permease
MTVEAASDRPSYLGVLRKTQGLAPILMMIVFVMSGNTLVAPILSLYAQSFQVTSTMVGALITLFGVGRLCANIPAGIAGQRLGLRPVLVLGPLVIAVGSIGAATATDFTVLLVWRFVQGLGSGIYMTSSAAALAAAARPSERGRTMSLYQGAMLLGASLGPGVGGWLATWFGFTAPFWAYAVMAGAAACVALISYRDTDPVVPRRAPGDAAGPVGTMALLAAPFIAAGLINFGVFFTRTASQWQLVPLVGHERFGLDAGTLGLALTVTAVANIVTLPASGWLIDRFGARVCVVVSTIALGLGLAVLTVAASVTWFWVAMALTGLAGGLNGPAINTYVIEIAPRESYGPALGIQRSAGDAGFIAGPIIVGLVDDLTRFGHGGGLVLNIAILVIAALSFAVVARRRIVAGPPSP